MPASPRQNTRNDPASKLDLLGALGLNQDPMQQLGGLVNLVNSLGEPGRQQQELQLRQQQGVRDQQQVTNQQDNYQMQAEHAAAQEKLTQEHWLKEFGAAQADRKSNRLFALEQGKKTADYQHNELLLHALGLPAQYQSAYGRQLDPDALEGIIPGLAGLSKAFPVQQETKQQMPANLSPEQKIHWQKRMDLGFTPQ